MQTHTVSLLMVALLTAGVGCAMQNGERPGSAPAREYAESPPPGAPASAEARNGVATSGDGAVVLAPIAPPRAETFVQFDANADGFISRDEARRQSVSERFDDIDTDKDSRISATEYDIFAARAATAGTGSGSAGDATQ